MNMNILAVDVNTFSTFGFLKDNETVEELQERANQYRQEQIDTWNNNRILYPCETYEKYYIEALSKEYKVMTFDEYTALEMNYYISKPVVEITYENYDDMLCCLPPMKWCTINGIEMFCMSEMLTGPYTSQFAKLNDKYYTKVVNAFDKSTWIHNFIQSYWQPPGFEALDDFI